MVGDQGLVAAKLLAFELHSGQQYGERPYTDHLQAVVDTLERFGVIPGQPWSAPVVVAAWLHDSLEDTVITRSELASRFGEAVADLVWRVTDEPGANRAARKRATYAKTRDAYSN
ncbi:MAG: HD domain-containing protein [bacterium]|nr:HD domain-containing protein [bacterium]